MADIPRSMSETPIEKIVPPQEAERPVEGERAIEAAPLPPPAPEAAPPPPEAIPRPAPPSPPPPPAKSALLARVEKILEEDIGEVYFSMRPEDQARFKEKSDATAREIEGLLNKAKATAARLLALLRSWLQSIPGVSRFFVERESKIKTDKLLALQRGKG